MADLDYQRWLAEALLSVVPRALTLVAEHGLPEGHALYISFDTQDSGVQIDQSLAEQHPEMMTVVLEHQYWDLQTDDDGFSVVLAFGGRRKPLYVPWSAIRAFADPPAEFAFDTSGQLSRGLRRLVGEIAEDDAELNDGPEDGPATFDSTSGEAAGGASRFVRRRDETGESGARAGEVVPFARPHSSHEPTADRESNQEEE